PDDNEDATRIDEILGDLVERDYLLKLPDSTFPGTDEYIFKHNKERIALEARISAAQKKRYHQTIADWLEYQSPSQQNEQDAAMLARHREAAAEPHLSGITYLRAGDLAHTRYANASA